MNPVNIFGTLATLASITSFLPQAWKIIKTRDTRSISTGMYCITVTGFALWAIYGFLLHQWPIIITNCICFTIAGFILLMNLLPQHKKDAVADTLDVLP